MIDIHDPLLQTWEAGLSTTEESIQWCEMGFREGMTRGGHPLSWG